MISRKERSRLPGSPHRTGTHTSTLRIGQLGRQLLKLDWLVVALVAIGMGLRLWLMVRGWPLLDSDEGVIGLMARHILYGGERPIFYYGQHYMGALEAYAAAAVFRFLGATNFALRLAVSPFILGFLITMYFLGRAAYGRITGLITLAFLTLGPAYGLLREQAAVGGYQETLLFGALLPVLVYTRLRSPRLPPATLKARTAYYTLYLLIGLIIGLGIWSDELILTLVVASVGALTLARPREVVGLAGLVLVLGVLIGGFPFIAYNLGHGGQTFIELSHQQLSGSGTGLDAVVSRVNLTVNQLVSVLATEMPAVLGSPHVCVVPGSLYAGYASYPAQAAAAGGGKTCAGVNSLFSLLVLAIYAFALRQEAVRLAGTRSPKVWLHQVSARIMSWLDHSGNSPRQSAPAGEDSAPYWLRALLVVAALATLAEFVLTNHSVVGDRFVSARYLLPLYITLPVVFGTLWEWAAPTIEALRRQGIGYFSDRGARSWWAMATVLTLVAMLAFSVLGATETVVTASDTSRFARAASPPDQRLMQELQALGIKRFYTDYWDCYDIAFESGEHLRCSLYQQVDRYPPYAALLHATAHPAYVLPFSQDNRFELTQASSLYRAGYVRVVSDGYAIYYLPGGQQNLAYDPTAARS